MKKRILEDPTTRHNFECLQLYERRAKLLKYTAKTRNAFAINAVQLLDISISHFYRTYR